MFVEVTMNVSGTVSAVIDVPADTDLKTLGTLDCTKLAGAALRVNGADEISSAELVEVDPEPPFADPPPPLARLQAGADKGQYAILFARLLPNGCLASVDDNPYSAFDPAKYQVMLECFGTGTGVVEAPAYGGFAAISWREVGDAIRKRLYPLTFNTISGVSVVLADSFHVDVHCRQRREMQHDLDFR